MTCSAPSFSAANRSCQDAPKRVPFNPVTTVGMLPHDLVLAVPPGSLLWVDYKAGKIATRTAIIEAGDAEQAGMPGSHFVGRLIDAHESFEKGRYRVTFRMITLNRGEPGSPRVRTFSTAVGELRGALLLEVPPV